jgi:hypothetical protein
MGLAAPRTEEDKQRAADIDAGYDLGWNEAIDTFASLLRSARHDFNYPQDAHAFIIHDQMLANFISRQMKENAKR